MKKILMNNIAIRFFIIAAMAAAISSCAKEPKKQEPVSEARPVRVMVLQGGAGETVRSYPAKTEAQDTVDLSFEVDGKIVELPASAGMKVAKGDIIAKLDARDYENEYAARKSDYERALSELNRYRTLYEKNAVSRQDLENKDRNKAVTEAALKIAEKKVQDTVLKAPFAGVVATVGVDNFQSVTAKEPIARIQNNEAIQVVVYLPERDLALTQTMKFKSATAAFDAFPGKRFDLELVEFETQADPVTQTFQAKFILPRPENINVLPGMSANVTLDLEPKEKQQPGSASMFILPSQAVAADPTGRSFVWVVDQASQTARRQDVEMGEITGTGSVQIKSGLEPGMMIVTAGTRELREGMKLTPRLEGEKITE